MTMTIKDNLMKELNYTTTENGDVAYKSTFNKNLDYFGLFGGMMESRHQSEFLFKEAYLEDKETALKNLLYTRDILGGAGFRQAFKDNLRYIMENHKEDAKEMYKLMPSIVNSGLGRWDDILIFLDYPESATYVAQYIYNQLMYDLSRLDSGENVSLCAKWMPSVNAGIESRRKAAKLIQEMNKYAGKKLNQERYRKILSKLRKKIDITEHYVTTENFEGINYSNVPSKAMNNYQNIFREKDAENFNKYVEALSNPDNQTEKVNVKTLFPHEIIKGYGEALNRWSNSYEDFNWDLKEAQWKAIERTNTDSNTIVVRDGSGSMSMTNNQIQPIDVASALAILLSEQINGAMKDTFITFSSKPELVDLSNCNSLKDKLTVLRSYNDLSNTDIMKVYQLIFNATLGLPTDEQIDRIVIISDMEFDAGTNVSRSWRVDQAPIQKATYEQAKTMFESAGMELPEIVYWNVEARDIHFPTTDIENVKLVSGFSNAVLQSVLNDETYSAIDFMMNTLDNYTPIVEQLSL